MELDFKELLSILNEDGVRYLIVGGYAVIKHTEPRYTKDPAKSALGYHRALADGASALA